MPEHFHRCPTCSVYWGHDADPCPESEHIAPGPQGHGRTIVAPFTHYLPLACEDHGGPYPLPGRISEERQQAIWRSTS